jgi:hypothetical protein
VYQNKLRFFQADNAKGGYIDMTALENGVSTNLAPYRYLYVTRATSNQTIGSGTWSNRDVIFNNVVTSQGITFDTSTGIATLAAGVYRISAQIAWAAAASYIYQWSCYDNSNTQLGPLVEQVTPTNGTNNVSSGILDFILSAPSGRSVKIRTNNNNTASTGEVIRFDLNTLMIIQQVG